MSTPPIRPKRLRLRKCTDKIRLPATSGSATAFEEYQCQLEWHAEGEHHHEGFVFMNNGTYRMFKLNWTGTGLATAHHRIKGQT